MIDVEDYEGFIWDFGVDVAEAVNVLDSAQTVEFFTALIQRLDSDSVYRLEDAIGMTI